MERVQSNAFFTDEQKNLGVVFGNRYVGIEIGYTVQEDGKVGQELELSELEKPYDFNDESSFTRRKDMPKVRLIFMNKESIDTVIHNLQMLRDRSKGMELLDSSIFGFDWSIRAQKVFEAAEIKTVRDLVRLKRADLLKFRNMGKVTLKEIDEWLDRKHLEFGLKV